MDCWPFFLLLASGLACSSNHLVRLSAYRSVHVTYDFFRRYNTCWPVSRVESLNEGFLCSHRELFRRFFCLFFFPGRKEKLMKNPVLKAEVWFSNDCVEKLPLTACTIHYLSLSAWENPGWSMTMRPYLCAYLSDFVCLGVHLGLWACMITRETGVS